MGKTRKKVDEPWTLTLTGPGGASGSITMTNDEMGTIVDNVDGSCLNTEAELCWLFREAGWKMPERSYRVSFCVNDAGGLVEVERAIEEALNTFGIKPVFGVDVDDA